MTVWLAPPAPETDGRLRHVHNVLRRVVLERAVQE
jgi:hypothetical protein